MVYLGQSLRRHSLVCLKTKRFRNFNFNAKSVHTSVHFFLEKIPMVSQLERLKQDSAELQIYAQKLEKRGDMDRKSLILTKLNFLNQRIAEVQSTTFTRTIST